MIRRSIYISLLAALLTVTGVSQSPQPHPPAVGGVEPRPHGPGASARRDWIKPHDRNDNGVLERDEFDAALEMTFTALDRDQDGTLGREELRVRAHAPGQMHGEERPQDDTPKPPLLPPFFVHFGAELTSITKADFLKAANVEFNALDLDKNGSLSTEEARKLLPPPPPPPPGPRPAHLPERPGDPPHPPHPPHAEFIGAEVRFGEKLVTGHPFSAEIVIEQTRRLFDGSLSTKQSRGAVYRDGAGRVRREQPLDMVGGVDVVGANKQPQTLVFITDLPNSVQIFLDMNNKVARKNEFIGNSPPPPPPFRNSESEELGTKTIEGVSAVGTRSTYEMRMPGGKTAQAVSEKWHSPELQTMIMSRHMDPITGEHQFKLVNIRLGEPNAGLFAIPAGYRVESRPGRKE